MIAMVEPFSCRHENCALGFLRHRFEVILVPHHYTCNSDIFWMPHKMELAHKMRLPHQMRVPQEMNLPHKNRLPHIYEVNSPYEAVSPHVSVSPYVAAP